MKKYRYILDLGSSNISIYSTGLLLRQPNVAVVRRGNGIELIAAGNDALPLIHALPEHCSVVYPVEEGAVVHGEVMSLVLHDFLSRIVPKTVFKAVEIYVLIPSGLSITERENIENAVARAGYKDVTLIESILALLPLFNGPTGAVIFGGGTTEIGVVNDSGILSACTINLGGKTIDEKIKEKILETYNLLISLTMAEKIKTSIGSLFENDTSTMEIFGKDILDGKMKAIEISAESVRVPIQNVYKKLAEIIESVLTTVSSKTMVEIATNGIYIAGAGAEMGGLTNFLAKYLKLPIKKDDDPEISALRSASIVVNDDSGKYSSILSNKR